MATTQNPEVIGSAPVKERANLSVLVVDPSNFSLPYDYALCGALAVQGCGITLVRSEDVYAAERDEDRFAITKPFYVRSHSYAQKYSRGRFWRVFKAGEHALDMFSFASSVRRAKPDIVHFQWLPIPLLDSLALDRIRGVAPVVLTLHNTSAYHGESAYQWHGIGTDAAIKKCDAIIVHTEYSKKNLLERGIFSPDQVHVIPHGVLDHGTPNVSRSESGEREILCFGTIKHYKGIDLLIRSLTFMPEAVRKSVRLRIAGYPSMDVSPLKALADQLNVSDRISWRLEFIPDEEVPDLFASASIVALPYRDIDQSGVLLTAISSGRPVIATRIGGIAETIQDGVHGRLIPPESPEALAEAITEVVNDEPKRQSMERAMQSLQLELSWDAIARKTIEVYRSIVRSR